MFVNMLFQGKLQQAVRWLTGREKGGLLKPDDTCSKTGLAVSKVLASKHPEPTVPPESALKDYAQTLICIDVNITGKVVEKVARCLPGVASLGRVDSIYLQDWLLQYGEVSRKLCEAISQFARWIANTYPLWAATRAYVMGRLISLDKCPGIRPVEAAEAYGVDQLCGGLRSGTKEGIHAMNNL
eukprot:5696650-Ditylum_brightwellii.AAC.1